MMHESHVDPIGASYPDKTTSSVTVPSGAAAPAPCVAPPNSSNAASGMITSSSSNAKRRLEAMATSVDHKLAAAFSAILILYSIITFGTWTVLEAQPYRLEVIEVIASSSSSSSSSSHQIGGLPGLQPEQQPHTEQERENATPVVIVDERSESNINNDNTSNKELSTSHTVGIRADDIPDIETLQHTFPIHASKDLEMINHPGIFFANREQMQRIISEHPLLPQSGKIAVPRFWKPKAYGPGGVREFLGQYGQRLITPEEADKIGSYTEDGQETVFISIASYRDWECQPTVSDIFERADHPERIRVAVVDQRVKGDDDAVIPPCGKPPVPCDQDPEQAMCKYAHLIDVLEIDAILSVGPVFARHLAYRMYRGEYYAMQVDSHVRFIEHWDTDLISQWKSAKNEMAVITTYLSDITNSIDPVTHANTHPNRPIMCKTEYEGQGKLKHLRHGQQPEGPPGIHGEPTLHPFWAAGFSFARGHFVVQVPYDQFQPMVFQGEEIFMGLRGFTYGYDYYTAETSVAFHMYAIKDNKEKREKINKFWENSNLYPGSAVEGMKRLNGIIGTGDPGDQYYHGEEKEYGLGQIRKKEKFYRLYGIHTESKTVEDHLCSFVGKPMQDKLKPALRANRMGIDFDQIDFEYKDPFPPTKAVKPPKGKPVLPLPAKDQEKKVEAVKAAQEAVKQ